MSNHTHICTDCDAEFPGDGLLIEVSEGEWECDCLRQDRCESCEPNCERCDEWDGIYTKASTENAHGEPRCERCLDRENEAASEPDYGGGAAEAMSRAYDAMEERRR